MGGKPATRHAAPRKRLIALCFAGLAFLTACSGGVTGTISTAAQDSASAIATARLALSLDSDGQLTRAAASTALDDALKELLTSRDSVLKLSPRTDEDLTAVQETLTVLDACATGLTTARDSLASDAGTPSRDAGSRELAAAADRLADLAAKAGGR